MARYARETGVSVGESQAEIRRLLERWGAVDVITGHARGNSVCFVRFSYRGVQYRVARPLPSEHDPDIAHTPGGDRRDAATRARFLAQAERQIWRVLLLLLKALIEDLDVSGLEPLRVLGGYVELADGTTVEERLVPMIEQARADGQLAGDWLPEGVDGLLTMRR